MKEHQLELRFKDLDGYQVIRPSLSLFFQRTMSSGCTLFEVAVHEAINNALKYGKTTKYPQSIVIKMDVLRNHWVIVRVKDHGKGFAPYDDIDEAILEQELLAESGRGIFIMKKATDRLYYNRQGNEVFLAKRYNKEEHPNDSRCNGSEWAGTC